MRWCALIVFCAVLITTLADPEPKKFKPGSKDVPSATSLTNDEKKFLREVESKFGIKSEVPVEPEKKEEKEENMIADNNNKKEDKQLVKTPFPAVIAIEIVNDTESDGKPSKGKRTIDANLGYGYRTNNGYSYTYFGNPSQDKGKFMIYPYSQHDIPPAAESKEIASEVEITPSRAFELVPVKNEQQTSYKYTKPALEFNEGPQAYQTQPPSYSSSGHISKTPSSILYTTYNGEKFSGLQNTFPKVMSNYLVNPSQLLQNSHYQSAGLTQDHLQPHGPQLQQRVVPVLVLRIPSSYLKNPSAELYANLPHNYPLSNYLNNVNLQGLVNQYFKKIGYPFAPQIMPYQNAAHVEHTNSASPTANYEPEHYAHPYVQPSYTYSDNSGVQYSAVQPVMAKYPGLQKYYKQQYYHSSSRPLHQSPIQSHNNNEYRYQFIHQPAAINPQSYYVQQQYQSPQIASHAGADIQQGAIEDGSHNIAGNSEYGATQEQYSTSQDSAGNVGSVYETPTYQNAQQYVTHNSAAEYKSPKQTYTEYEAPKEEHTELNSGEIAAPNVGPTKVPISTEYGSPLSNTQYKQDVTHTQAYINQNIGHHGSRPTEVKTITIYPQSNPGHTTKYIVRPESGSIQSYIYQKHVGEDSASQSLVISENYPSQYHTQAHAANPATDAKQTVSYVTPEPIAANKYMSKYHVMVPQTVFKNPEHVSYVNSHSLPMHYLRNQESNPEEEYTVSHHHVPAVGNQKSPGYPRNYHSHKRMTNKNESKQEADKVTKKENTEKIETKKST